MALRDSSKDFLLYLGILLAIGVLWMASGAAERTEQSSIFSAPRIKGVDRPSRAAEKEVRSVSAQLSDIERQLERARIEGIASPFQGLVGFDDGEPESQFAGHEYVTIRRARGGDDEGILVTGWMLESLVTGIRVPIGGASPLPFPGRVNSEPPIRLRSGDELVIISGRSPIGTSFRLNRCTGYFDQFQNFTPELPHDCPSPVGEYRDKVDPIGFEDEPYEACLDYLAEHEKRCEIDTIDLQERDRFRTLIIDPQPSPACLAFITTDLTYEGCVNNHQFDRNFFENEWRVYLGSSRQLWRNIDEDRHENEILRLLDQNGRVVDIWRY